MNDDRDHLDPLSDAEEAHLIDQLEGFGRSARDCEGLAQRLFAASVSELEDAPQPLPFSSTPSTGLVWARLALAACILLAFAVTLQMFLSPFGSRSGTGPQGSSMVAVQPPDMEGLPDDLDRVSDRETVLFTLLDAGATGQLDAVGELDGSDSYGIAFSPILGTAGFELTDFAEEIQSIHGSMRR